MRKKLRWAILIFAIAAISLPAPQASADTDTFNSIFFRPATGKNPYFMLHGTQTLHQLQFDAGWFFSYAYRPVEIGQGGTRIRGVIDNLVVADFVAAVGATEWLQFGIDFPLILINKFADPRTVGSPPLNNHFDIGDLRAEAKVRVLDPCDQPVGLAFIPFITAPTGNSSHYVGDSGITGGIKVALDAKVHEKIGLAFNAGYQGGKKVLLRNIEYQNLLLLGIGIQGMFSNGVGVFGEIDAKGAFNKLFRDKDLNPTQFLAGASWDIKETGVTVSGGGGTCLVCGTGGAKAMGVVSAKYRFNPEKFREMDREEGGVCAAKFEKGLSTGEIENLIVKCPENPAMFRDGVDDPTCPKYYELREVADLVLRCPSKSEDFDPALHDAACPKVFNLAAAYSAEEIQNIYTLSVADMDVLCPANPDEFNPQLHDVGCPKYYDLKEMVVLSQKCPASVSEYREGVDDPSCPKLFTLKDTYTKVEFSEFTLAVAEEKAAAVSGPSAPAALPTRAPVIGRPSAVTGAAAKAFEGIREGEVQTFKSVYFGFDSAKIRSADATALDRVIAVINKTPWVKRVSIGGHSDGVGPKWANEKMSAERAEAVISYMKAHGIRQDVMLVPIAYGSFRPAVPNITPSGRAENRRVSFVVTGYLYKSGENWGKRVSPVLKPVHKPVPEAAGEKPGETQPPEPAADEESSKKPRMPKKWR